MCRSSPHRYGGRSLLNMVKTPNPARAANMPKKHGRFCLFALQKSLNFCSGIFFTGFLQVTTQNKKRSSELSHLFDPLSFRLWNFVDLILWKSPDGCLFFRGRLDGILFWGTKTFFCYFCFVCSVVFFLVLLKLFDTRSRLTYFWHRGQALETELIVTMMRSFVSSFWLEAVSFSKNIKIRLWGTKFSSQSPNLRL